MTTTTIGGMEATIFLPEYSKEQQLAVVPMKVLKHLVRGIPEAPMYQIRQHLINRLQEASTMEAYMRALKEEYDYHDTILSLTTHFREKKEEKAFSETGDVLDLIN